MNVTKVTISDSNPKKITLLKDELDRVSLSQKIKRAYFQCLVPVLTREIKHFVELKYFSTF